MHTPTAQLCSTHMSQYTKRTVHAHVHVRKWTWPFAFPIRVRATTALVPAASILLGLAFSRRVGALAQVDAVLHEPAAVDSDEGVALCGGVEGERDDRVVHAVLLPIGEEHEGALAGRR